MKCAVYLDAVGQDKIRAIKILRSLNLGISLKEAADFMENLPRLVKSGLKNDEAIEIKRMFEVIGAKASIRT